MQAFGRGEDVLGRPDGVPNCIELVDASQVHGVVAGLAQGRGGSGSEAEVGVEVQCWGENYSGDWG